MRENLATAVKVVAGLIFRRNRLLVCQRKGGGPFPLKWEFPGGKVEPGEIEIEALKRELQEELAIEIGAATEVFRNRHRYPNQLEVELAFYRVDRFKGPMENRVFQELRWVSLAELGGLDFVEGDLPLIDEMVSGRLAV